MIKKSKDLLLKTMNKMERAYERFVIGLMLAALPITNVYAETPKLVTGTVALFNSITSWLLLIIPVGAGAIFGYHALMKTLTDDDAVIAQRNKYMKNTLISAAVAMTATGTIKIFLSFYS